MSDPEGTAAPARRNGQGPGRPNGHHGKSQDRRSRAPGVVLVSGRRVVVRTGAELRSPQPGPADEMLERLWGVVGHNGLIMIGPDAPDWTYLVTEPGAWKRSGGPAWFTAARGETRLRLALLDKINPDNDPLIGPDELATVTRHARFADLLGVPFYADGGTTSALLMEETIRPNGNPVLRAWRDERAPRAVEASWLGPWTAPSYCAQSAQVRLDKNAYYLCAANLTHLPLDALRHTEGSADPKLHVGLWRIRTPASPEERLPHPLGMGRNAQPGVWRWVAHPTMELLGDLGVRVEIGDSWTLPRARSRRLLSPWYDRLRNARAAARTYDDDDARALQQALKDTYSRGIGCLDREGRRWYRPDWRAMIYAQARANFYRALLKTGRELDRWPAETRTDMVIYEGTDTPATLKVGDGLGEWKVIR